MNSAYATISPATRRSVLLLSFATFASMTVQRLCDPMLPALSREFDVSLAQAARVVSMFAVVYGLAQLIYGPLGDRFGKFRVITLATLGCSLGCLAAALATSLDSLVWARILMALAGAAVIPMSLAWIGDAVDYELRQETLARVGLGTTMGVAAGQLLGGLFTDMLSWRAGFGFMMVLFGGVGLLLLAELRRQQAASTAPAAPPAAGGGFARQARGLLRDRWTRTVLTVSVLEGAAAFGVVAICASHLHHQLGVSLAMAGSVMALFGIGGMLYMAIAGRMIRRFGEHGLAFWGGALLALSELVIAFTPFWILAVPASLLAGFGFFMFHNTVQVNATQMAPQARGVGVAMFAAFLFMGQSLGVLALAGLVDYIGTSYVIALGAMVMLSLGAWFSYGLQRRHALS